MEFLKNQCLLQTLEKPGFLSRYPPRKKARYQTINLKKKSRWQTEKNPGLKQTLISQDLDIQKSRCRLKGRIWTKYQIHMFIQDHTVIRATRVPKDYQYKRVIQFTFNLTVFNCPKHEHVLFSNMFRLKVPASWPRLPVQKNKFAHSSLRKHVNSVFPIKRDIFTLKR